MEPARKRDLQHAAAIALPVPFAAIVLGDPLFIGLWYYLVIPAFIIGTGLLMKAPPPYLTGASLTVAAAYLVYMMVNYTATQPEGLLGLGHLFSVPGGLIGHLLGISLARRRAVALPMLTLGALGWGAGFVLNQLLVCNTGMYCGPLSLNR